MLQHGEVRESRRAESVFVQATRLPASYNGARKGDDE